MDPLTLALMGGSALSNIVGGVSATNTARQNLMQTALNNYNQDRYSQAGATDEFGNTNNYDKALNQWITKLSPTQQRIADADQSEQLASLLHDAPQNRIMRDNAFQRSRMGSDAFKNEFAKYRYGQPEGEGAIQNDLVGLMARARGNPDAQGSTSRETLRNKGKVAVVRSGSPTGGNGSVDDIAQIMLDARKGALGEAGQRNSQFNQNEGARLGEFGSIANGQQANINTNAPGSGLMSQQERMAQARAAALENVSKNSQFAYGNLDKTELSAGKNIAGSLMPRPSLLGKPVKPVAGATPPTGYGDSSDGEPDWYGSGKDPFQGAYSLY
jgi:hypothetical protein